MCLDADRVIPGPVRPGNLECSVQVVYQHFRVQELLEVLRIFEHAATLKGRLEGGRSRVAACNRPGDFGNAARLLATRKLQSGSVFVRFVLDDTQTSLVRSNKFHAIFIVRSQFSAAVRLVVNGLESQHPAFDLWREQWHRRLLAESPLAVVAAGLKIERDRATDFAALVVHRKLHGRQIVLLPVPCPRERTAGSRRQSCQHQEGRRNMTNSESHESNSTR